MLLAFYSRYAINKNGDNLHINRADKDRVARLIISEMARGVCQFLGYTYGQVPDLRRLCVLGCCSAACNSACGIRLLDGLRLVSRYSGLSAVLLQSLNDDSSLSEPHHKESIDNIVPR